MRDFLDSHCILPNDYYTDAKSKMAAARGLNYGISPN